MHILFLTHYFPPEVNAPATRTFAHCRRWVEMGHSVTVITCSPSFPSGVVFDGYRNAWSSEEWVHGIRVLRVWTILSANRGFFWRIASFLSYMIRATIRALTLSEIDVVVATTPQFFCGWAGVLCKWIRRLPFVLEVRDIWPESIVAVGAMKRSPVVKLLEWLEARMYASADHIVTVGDGYKKQLLARKVPSHRITVVPNGVDDIAEVSTSQIQQLRRDLKAEGKCVCTYIGTIGAAHGLDVVLEAAALLKEAGAKHICFWLVGDGAERGRLENRCREMELTNVQFTGLVSKAEAPVYIAASDVCLVHLRRKELFDTVIPSKIFEIMAANTPILIGVGGDARDMVLGANAGLDMIPEDAHSLVESLETILSNPDQYQHGRAYVARKFQRDELARRMLATLRQQTESGLLPFPAERVNTIPHAPSQSGRAA